MTDIQHQREHLELLVKLAEVTRIQRESMELLRDVNERLARIEGRTIPPTKD